MAETSTADGHRTGEGFAEPPAMAEPNGRLALARLGFFAAGAVLAVAAGLLLWWREGAGVFSEHLLAAIAWCF